MNRVKPEQIEKFLLINNWTKIENKLPYVNLYIYKELNILDEVMVPLDQTLLDYHQVLYQAIKTIAEIHRLKINFLIEILIKM